MRPFFTRHRVPSSGVTKDAENLENLIREQKPIEWSEFQATVPLSRIQRVVFSSDLATALVEVRRGLHLVSVHESLRPWLLTDLLEKRVPYRILSSPLYSVVSCLSLLLPLLPILFTSLVAYLLMHRLPGVSGGGGASVSSFHVYRPNASESWIGSPEVLQECMETVDFVRGGGDVPRGLLLEGEPGTGKTLLARKIAAEAHAAFIPVVGSQFVEVYVGLGAQRVRQLFAFARQHAPAIIFIDELDSMATRRGYGHSEGDNTLNQLLAEMDGFVRDVGVFVLGASNRVSIMDPALLRPGRFDRVVRIPMPDETCRKKLFVHFLQQSGLPVAPDLDYEMLAVLSQGFSGAVIQKVVREAGLFAERNHETVLEARHLDTAMEKEWVGLLKTEDDRSPEEITRVAVHECGHALLAHHFFRLRKISIRANHQGMGGFTLYDDSSVTDPSPTRETLENRITVLLGGRAAEVLWYDRRAVSVGAVQDLAIANQLAEAMITELGFSERFPSLAPRSMAWSNDLRDTLHGEIQLVLDRSLQEATRYLNSTRGVMAVLVDELVVRKSVNETRFLSLMAPCVRS